MMRQARLTTVAAALLALAIGAGTGTAEAALVGYWDFDAADAADLSGNSNDGVVGTAVTFTSQTPFGVGQAVQSTLTGASIITVADSPTLQSLSDQLTISFWMKADSAANNNWFRLFRKGTEAQYQQSWMVNRNSSTSTMNVRVDTNQDPSTLYPGFNQNIAYADGTTILDDQWHHLVFIMDNGQWRKYVDGAPQGSGTYTHNHGFGNDRPLQMLTGNYAGLLDDVAVWSEPLSTSQVQSINTGGSPLNTPLVSIWRFEDHTNPGKDWAATGNDLTAQGNAAITGQGRFGNGLALDGAGDFLDSAAFPNGIPIGDSDYTIAAWFKPDVTGNRGIIGWGDYGTGLEVNALRLIGANGFRHYWWGADLDATDAEVAGLGVDLDDGQWHHITATYDGTTRTLWLDGQYLDSDTPVDHLAAASNFRIGSTNFAEFFDGTLDDVAVFSAALTQAEIQRIMTGDFSAYYVGIPEPGSVVLLGLGALCLAGCGWRRRRRRQACRLCFSITRHRLPRRESVGCYAEA